MFYLTKPTEENIEKLIETQSSLELSYKNVGATKDHNVPKDFQINHYLNKLGNGEQVFKKAIEAIHSWQMYELGWTFVKPKNPPIKEGEIFLTMISHLGFWSLNPCRIVYLIDTKTSDSHKLGFAIGTLPAHSETGEERFLIEWNQNTDEVFYEIYSFAKPHNSFAKIASPYVEYLQKYFAKDSHKAMLQYVHSE